MVLALASRVMDAILFRHFDKTDYDSGVDVSAGLSHLLRPWEHIITPDFFGYWTRHVVWAKSDGKEVKEYCGKRYSTSMVFMSLLLNAQLALVFSPCDVCTRIRSHLQHGHYGTLDFFVGLALITSVFCTLFALFCIFIVWGMINTLSNENCLCVVRSSIGQYATQLPSRFVVTTLLLFLTSMSLFQFLLLPRTLAALICLLCVSLYLHIVRIYSVFGRLLMHSGVMNDHAVFQASEESVLRPNDLHEKLGARASEEMRRNMSVTIRYRRDQDMRADSVRYQEILGLAAAASLNSSFDEGDDDEDETDDVNLEHDSVAHNVDHYEQDMEHGNATHNQDITQQRVSLTSNYSTTSSQEETFTTAISNAPSSPPPTTEEHNPPPDAKAASDHFENMLTSKALANAKKTMENRPLIGPRSLSQLLFSTDSSSRDLQQGAQERSNRRLGGATRLHNRPILKKKKPHHRKTQSAGCATIPCAINENCAICPPLQSTGTTQDTASLGAVGEDTALEACQETSLTRARTAPPLAVGVTKDRHSVHACPLKEGEEGENSRQEGATHVPQRRYFRTGTVGSKEDNEDHSGVSRRRVRQSLRFVKDEVGRDEEKRFLLNGTIVENYSK